MGGVCSFCASSGDDGDERETPSNKQPQTSQVESSIADNIYGICKDDNPNDADEQKTNSQSLPKRKCVKDWFKNKNSKIVIIGAGPAGIHMASQLQARGYKDVCILERNKKFTKRANDSWNERGKSVTIKDEELECVHEMGTCYLHPKYDEIRNLIRKYDSDNTIIPYGNSEKEIVVKAKDFKDNIVEKFEDHPWKYQAMPWDEWASSEVEKLTIPEILQWLPDAVSILPLKVAADKYVRLHKEIFGDYHDEIRVKGEYNSDSVQFPPKPAQDINMTMLQWMLKHELQALIPNFIYSQAIQGMYNI